MTQKTVQFSPKIFLIALIVIVVSFFYLKNIYIPIFISYFLAFLLNPLIEFAENRGFGRIIPICTLLVLVFALVFIGAALMLPHFLAQFSQLLAKIPAIVASIADVLSPYSIHYLGYDLFHDWHSFAIDIVPLLNHLPAADILSSVFSGTLHAFSTLLTILMIPLMTFYFLKDYNELNEKILQFVPRRYVHDVAEIMHRMSKVLGSLIRGQFLVCLILAAYYSVALSAVGVEMALLLGVLSGFMSLIPIVGTLTAATLTVVMSVLGGGGFTLVAGIVGIFLVANLLDGTVLTPKIVGRQIGISPLIIILALLAGAELLGFLGMLLALPVTAMVKVLGGYLAETYFNSTYYKDPANSVGKQD